MCFLLILGAIVSVCQAAAGERVGPTKPAGSEGVMFQQYEFVTGPAKHQTILTGFFLDGDMAEIAEVHVRETGERHLRLYSFGAGNWAPRVEATLNAQVQFVDVVHIDGQDRLVTYVPGQLFWFDPNSATERPLLKIAIKFKATSQEYIPHIDLTRDLNYDGHDDLVIPDVNGFWISTQLSDGAFTEPVRLGPPEPFREESPMGTSGPYGEMGITAETIPWYLSRVHVMDYDLDGLSDLVFWNENHFDVYCQDEQGRFDPVAKTVSVDVPFDADGSYSLMFAYSGENTLRLMTGLRKKTQKKVLYALRDLNGDHIADLITMQLTGRSIMRHRSRFEVHFGRRTPDGVQFAREVSTAIDGAGKAGAMQPWGYASQLFEDFDGDGQVDIMLKDVAVGVGGMVRAMAGNSVAINLEFYRMDGGRYPDKPTTKRKIRRFAPLDGLGNVFFPVVLMGDVNGDGRSDLLVGHSPKMLHIYRGVPGAKLLAPQPQKVAVAMPYNELNTRLVDLNKDGKQDLVMLHGPSEPDQRRRLTMLVAQ